MAVVLLCAAAPATSQLLPPTRGTTDEHIKVLERRLKPMPGDPALLDELAGAYLQKMRETADGSYLERADRIVTSVLKSEPARYDARRRQIEIEMQRHHFRRVVELARGLVSEQARDAAVWSLMGDAFMEIGEYEEAASAYQNAVDLRPDLASYNRVAFYRFVTGDADGGIELMRLAIRADSSERENVSWCLAELGRMLLKTGATDQAEEAFRQALGLFPGYHPALAGLARVHAARAQFPEAIRLLLEAQAKAPFPEYAGLLAKLYRKTGKPELARSQIALLDVSDRLDQAAGESANRTLSLTLSDLGHRLPRALELARAELAVRQDVYTQDALAWALFRNGKLKEAAAAIEKALSRDTPEPAFHDHAAQIYETLGRTGEAKLHRSLSHSGYWQ